MSGKDQEARRLEGCPGCGGIGKPACVNGSMCGWFPPGQDEAAIRLRAALSKEEK